MHGAIHAISMSQEVCTSFVIFSSSNYTEPRHERNVCGDDKTAPPVTSSNTAAVLATNQLARFHCEDDIFTIFSQHSCVFVSLIALKLTVLSNCFNKLYLHDRF